MYITHIIYKVAHVQFDLGNTIVNQTVQLLGLTYVISPLNIVRLDTLAVGEVDCVLRPPPLGDPNGGSAPPIKDE